MGITHVIYQRLEVDYRPVVNLSHSFAFQNLPRNYHTQTSNDHTYRESRFSFFFFLLFFLQIESGSTTPSENSIIS